MNTAGSDPSQATGFTATDIAMFRALISRIPGLLPNPVSTTSEISQPTGATTQPIPQSPMIVPSVSHPGPQLLATQSSILSRIPTNTPQTPSLSRLQSQMPTDSPQTPSLSQLPSVLGTNPIAPYQTTAFRLNAGLSPTQGLGHPSNPQDSGPRSTISMPVAFRGIQSLGGNVNRQIVNQQRRASAAATLPQSHAVQRRRGRGTAIHPPGLSQIPSMRQAAYENDADGIPSYRIRAKVYPPTENISEDVVLYRNYIDSFNACLQSFFLLNDYDLPASTTIGQVIELLTNDMKNCPLRYEFAQRTHSGIIRHEALPLRLLALKNRGRSRPSDGQTYIQRMAIAASTPLSQLFGNANYYANPRLCLESGRFVLNFIGAQYPFTAHLPSNNDGVSTQLHRCISERIYQIFPYDGYTPIDDNDVEAEIATTCINRCRDLGAVGEDRSGQPIMESNTGFLHANQAEAPPEAAAQPMILRESSNRPVTPIPATLNIFPPRQAGDTLDHSQIQPATWSLPDRIWTGPWFPPPLPDAIEDLSSAEDVGTYVMEHATMGGPRQKLSVRGKNVADMAIEFRHQIAQAAATKDFSIILTPDREFIVERDDHSIRALGVGVELEVLYTAFSQFQLNSAQWFLPRVDNSASLAVMHSYATSRMMSATRKEGMEVLGALTALLLINGVPPTPLSLVVLHWLIYSCDVHSLHSDLILEWHPELAATIKRWIETGPLGPVSSFQGHFGTWHDIQVNVLNDRDEASHHAFASEMLYRAIIGPEPGNHPEIQAFIAGFRLPCSNGFDFIKVLRSFEGGAEMYLNMIWTSQIKDFTDLEDRIVYRTVTPSTLSDDAFSHFPTRNTNLCKILSDFLKGVGIPCPSLFEEAKPHFTHIVHMNLEHINAPSFRSRMFCWAATGSPTMTADFGEITVCLVGDQDANYSAVPRVRDTRFMLAEGKISFRTCIRQVRFPASYFSYLSGHALPYEGHAEPISLEKAVEHWILVEILNAIGGHSML